MQSAAPSNSPAAKPLKAMGRMLRKKSADADTASSKASSSQMSHRAAAVPPKGSEGKETTACQGRAHRSTGQKHLLHISASASSVAQDAMQGAQVAAQDKADKKATVGSRLYGLRVTAGRVARAEKDAAAKAAGKNVADKTKEAVKAKGKQTLPTRKAVASTEGSAPQPTAEREAAVMAADKTTKAVATKAGQFQPKVEAKQTMPTRTVAARTRSSTSQLTSSDKRKSWPNAQAPKRWL